MLNFTYNSLERYFKSSDSGQDLVVALIGITVGDELTVYFKINPRLGDFVNQHLAVRNVLLNLATHYKE